MLCKKCKKEIPDESTYCCWCGAQQQAKYYGNKRHGNGSGTVEKISVNNYKAIAVIGYKDNDYSKPIRRTKQGFRTKTEAYNYISNLKSEAKKQKDITLKELYDKWVPTHEAGRSTMKCYKSGFDVFKDCWYIPLSEQNIEELQNCLNDCEKGFRTKENAKTVLSLLYKFGIPRKYVSDNINLGMFIKCGKSEQNHKDGLNLAELNIIKNAIGKLEYAEYIYCHCYLGFRPTELLNLKVKDYNKTEKAFVAGIKTKAGINRTVTISPKIQDIIDCKVKNKNEDEYIFDFDGTGLTIDRYRKIFYELLDKLNIQGINDQHRLTPHSCRHTFATLMKAVEASDKDKISLIGHANDEQLRYYQDVSYDDLRKITDNL